MKKFTNIALCAALMMTSTTAWADDKPAPIQTIMPENVSARALLERFGFSQAVIHGDTVYLSGVIAGPVPEGMTDEEMYERVFAHIGTTLQRTGSSWNDVIDITTFHVDIDQSIVPLAAAKDKFVNAPFPAWTAIGIDRLFTPDGLVEIKVVARLTPKAN